MFGINAQSLDSALAQASAMRKADTISVSTGIVAYDLQPKLVGLVPTLFPFVSRCARKVSSNGGTATNWKSVTAFNTTNIPLGVSEGNRNQNIQTTVVNNLALYKTLGLEADLTFEAEEAAENFDDARAMRTELLLNAVRVGEEKVSLFGNGDATLGNALGTMSTPTLVTASGGGTVAAATYFAYVVALTYEGYSNATIAAGVPTLISRTNVDGSTDTFGGGSSIPSAASGSSVLGAIGTATVSWAYKAGAFGYAVYLGTSAGTAVLAGLTTALSLIITAPPAGTQVVNTITVDNSLNALEYTGMLQQILNPVSGAYVKALNAAFTSDGAGGINEIDVALQSLYDNYRVGVHRILMSSYDHLKFSKLVIANGGAPLVRFTGGMDNGNQLVGGQPFVTEYYNKFTGERIIVETHPYLPKGIVIGYAEKLPTSYLVGEVPVPFQIKCRRNDWYEIEWPLVTRRRQHGQYLSSLFQYYAPFSAFALMACTN